MKKQVLAALAAAAMLTAGVASASPLTDYSLGKASVDLTYRHAKQTMTDGGKTDFDSKYNPEVGVTVGLGNNFAFQYNGSYYESKDTSFGPLSAKTKIQSNEYNVLYKLDKNISAYAGVDRVQGKLGINGLWADSESDNRWQVGLVGSTELAKNLTAYAKVGAGDDLTRWGIGVGYQFAPGLEFNVDYMETKVDNFAYKGYKADGKAKGLGLGVTYKF
jgi:hypothetical protein